MAHNVEDAKMTRLVQRELGRRPIDITRMTIRYTHGTVYLYGIVRRLRGHENLDLKEEMNIIYRLLRSRNGIREVHMEELVIRA